MFENTLRYNHRGEQKAVKEAAEHFDSLLIPAHFVAASPRKIAARVERLKTDHGTEFYIDPQLPEFRVGENFWEKPNKLGEWNQALIDYYGKPISDILRKSGNVSPLDLSEEQLRDVVRKQCDLQLDMVADGAQTKLEQYIDIDVELRPRALVPWYVKIQSTRDLRINRKTIEMAQNYEDYPVKPLFFVTPDFLQQSSRRETLVNTIEECGVREAFIWVEGFSKRDLHPMDYVRTADLVYKTSEIGVRPHLLYGSYFGHLLGYLGNCGVGFGPAYQESRSETTDDDSGGGGGGTNRYYFDPVKTFLNFQEAEEFGNQFEEELCDCVVCKMHLDSWGDVYKFDGDYTTQQRHYIESRGTHTSKLTELSLSDQLSELEAKHSAYKNELGESDTAAQPHHLIKWTTGVKHFVEEELDQTIEDFDTIPESAIEA
jgi:hypothetical protein